MESHMSRFRIPLSSKKQPTRASAPRNSVTGQNSVPSLNANEQSIHPKRPHDRPSLQCATCGGIKLRPVSPETAVLQARLAWVESIVNKSGLLGDGRNIQELATGTDISSLVGASSPSLTHSAKGSPTERVSNRTPIGTDGDSTHQEAHEVENDEPPSKRPRLSILSDQVESADTLVATRSQTPSHLRPDVYALVDVYFRDVNRTYPFIHRESVISTLQKKGTSIFAFDLHDVAATTAYLVIAIGYASLQRAEQSQRNPSTPFFVHYKEILAEYLTQETISAVEILLLVSIYSQFDPNGCTAWPVVDMLARKAIRLGLTRRDTAEDGCAPEEAERRRRLFWSIYVWDRIVAMSTGVPAALSDANMDMPLPGITVDEFASASRLEHTSVLQVSRQIIQLRILEDKVLHEIHLRDHASTRNLTQADRRGIVGGLRTEIENWYSNGCLLKSTGPDEAMVHIRISWLSARYYNLLLLLYYPSHFNPAASLVSRGELVSLAQKHVQATAVRWQQQHLPLNQLTLCRLFPVCIIFLHCFLSHAAEGGGFPAADEVSICSDIMAAFPENWKLAHKSAAIMGQLVSLIKTSAACDSAAPFSVPAPRSLSEADKAWLYAIQVNLTELAQQVMGKGSTFIRWDHTGQERETGSLQPNTRPISMAGIDLIARPGASHVQAHQQTSPNTGSDQLELPAGDMYIYPNGISILDFS